MKLKFWLIMFSLGSGTMTATAQVKTDKKLVNLLNAHGSSFLKDVLSKPEEYQYQIIYTEIDRDRNNIPKFKSWYLNTDRTRYFNPASTVKLPVALLALEKLNDLKVSGLDRYTAMLTDSAYAKQTKVLTDKSSQNGFPSIAHYIKKIFLVSDNDAYNRLYEWIGQKELNEKLWNKGYKDVRITRRFVPLSDEENRRTNPIRFISYGKEIFRQPEAYSDIVFDFSKPAFLGKAHYNREEKLIMKPMDFTRHNNFPLEDQQKMLKAVLFPNAPKSSSKYSFNLTEDDYAFLHKYMAMLPSESDYPKYVTNDTSEFFDSYTKFFFKAGRGNVPANIRVFNKPGWSYGFLTDNAYVADFSKDVEYMLSAVIYVNSDGILNDDKYDYENIGLPFFREINQIIYNYEIKRKRKYKPELSQFSGLFNDNKNGRN